MASPGEIVGLVVGLGAGLATGWVTTRGRARFALAAAILGASAASAAALGLPARALPPPGRPRSSVGSMYVSSAACRSCHPGEHATFSRTFHRAMTQDATPATVVAPLDGRPLRDVEGDRDRSYALTRRGDEVWATLGERQARVVLTTGSHREQAFWVAGERAGELRLFPFVWLVRDARFIPRSQAFLRPPDAPMPEVRWNSNCIACHAVAGEPGHDEGRDAFDTRAAELGVACEACHGPGGAHVEKHRDPVARYMQYASKRADHTIVHPGRLSPERSAALCGQCHAYAFPRDEDAFWTSGYAKAFRPGDRLEPSRILLTPAAMDARDGPRIDAERESLFWPDGGIRVGGREYNALVLSPCYLRGEGERKMTCLSCHAMHAGDPAGQLAPDRAGDAACRKCHGATREHAHHAPGSPGASCLGCHMAKTSYALFGATRSHRIETPSASLTADTGKPNACNLCHLDKSLAWTAERLTAWYGAPSVRLEGARATVAAGIFEALTGDAAVRVLVADALGSPESRAACGTGWQGQPLAELLVDPYAAVRFVAARSRASLASLDGPSGAVTLARGPAREPLSAEQLRALLAVRDRRAITIAE